MASDNYKLYDRFSSEIFLTRSSLEAFYVSPNCSKSVKVNGRFEIRYPGVAHYRQKRLSTAIRLGRERFVFKENIKRLLSPIFIVLNESLVLAS